MEESIEFTIESKFKYLDETNTATHSKREKLLNKMMGIVEDTNIDPQCDKASEIEAKLMIIDSAAKLLNDIDKQTHNNVGMHLKRKSEETNESTAKEVVQLLSKIQFGQESTPIENFMDKDIDSKLDDVYNAKCDPIAETEKREDHEDLT